MCRKLLAVLIAAATMAVVAQAVYATTVKLEVLSSKPNQVSGGDALVRVDAPANLLGSLRVKRNGADVTDAFSPQGGGLVGLVEGLQLGKNELAVVRTSSTKKLATLKLHNYPTTGPIFSGPHQRPFVCQTIQAGLGEPLVDNQQGQGFRVQNAEGSTASWSLNCSVQTTVDYQYRTTGGQFRALPSDGSRPADMAQTTLLDGRTVDYVVRRERGTINRFIYSFAVLAPFGEQPGDDPDTSARPSRQADAMPEAFEVIDEWMANIRAHPDLGVAGNKPELATDRCFTTQGEEIARGPYVWDGILDDGPAGECTQEFPLHSTSRIVAGGPLRGGVYKCALQSVDDAIANGVYGLWTPSAAEVARLKEIFPTGVCDYSQGDAGRP